MSYNSRTSTPHDLRIPCLRLYLRGLRHSGRQCEVTTRCAAGVAGHKTPLHRRDVRATAGSRTGELHPNDKKAWRERRNVAGVHTTGVRFLDAQGRHA